MKNATVAEQLCERLSLDRPPMALAFVQTPPEGIERFAGAVPSACSFWRLAEEAVFYASNEQHYNCPIGAMTMGFEMTDEVKGNLMQLVELMCADQYITPDEPPAIPTVTEHTSGIVYGPLTEFPLEPDIVLMWLMPRQAMLYNEAAGSAKWSSGRAASLFGRPTCAALPVSLEEQRPTMSLGCIGMRTFTGASPETMLASVPWREAGNFLEALATTAEANARMGDFYAAHKAHFV